MKLGSDVRALVTGATSGIGDATVRALRAESVEVLALGRNAEALAALAEDTGCRQLAADVRERLVPGLRACPHAMVLIAYRNGQPVGLATCFFGFR